MQQSSTTRSRSQRSAVPLQRVGEELAGDRCFPLLSDRGRPAARAAPLGRTGRANTAPQSPTPRSNRPCTLHHQEQQPVAQWTLHRATGSNGGLHREHRCPGRTGLINTGSCTPIVASTDSASGAGCRSLPLRAELGPGAAESTSATGRGGTTIVEPLRGNQRPWALEALRGAVSASDGLDRRSGARRPQAAADGRTGPGRIMRAGCWRVRRRESAEQWLALGSRRLLPPAADYDNQHPYCPDCYENAAVSTTTYWFTVTRFRPVSPVCHASSPFAP